MEYECDIKLFLTVIFVSLLLSNIGLRLIICMRLRIVLTKLYVNVYKSIILLITINFIFCTLQPHIMLWCLSFIDIYILFMFMDFSLKCYILYLCHARVRPGFIVKVLVMSNPMFYTHCKKK